MLSNKCTNVEYARASIRRFMLVNKRHDQIYTPCEHRYVSTAVNSDHRDMQQFSSCFVLCKALSHGAIFHATYNAILHLRDVNW